jgi:hypothetical protein
MDSASILPVLVPTDATSARDGLPELAGEAPPTGPFVPRIRIEYFAHQARRVSRQDMVDVGLTEASLHEAAIANLRSRAAATMRVKPYGSIVAVFMDGEHETSLLLLDELSEIWRASCGWREIAAAIPARDVLAIGDATERSALRELRAVVERTWPGGDHLLLQTLVVRRRGAWQILDGSAESTGDDR